MSTTHEAPAGSTPFDEDAFPEPAPAEAASGFRARLDRNRLPLIAAVAVVGVLGGTVAAWTTTRSSAPTARPTATSTGIELPAGLAGLATLTADPLHGASWQAKVHQAIGDAAWGARSYGSAGTGKTIRVVAARTDLTGKLEQAWAVDNGTHTGSVSCTHDTKLTAGGKAFERPTLLVCWRTTSDLSAYALVIDPKAKTPVPDADGVAAVETAWKAAGGTD